MTSFSAPLRSLTLIALAAGMAHAAVDITSVSPNHGVITGGTVVVITGTGLAGLDTAAEITFGGTAVASVISFSATQVVVTTPVMTQGSIAVAGSDGGSSDSLAGFIAYESDVAALQINISVSIAQTLYLAWTAATKNDNPVDGTGGDAVVEGDTSPVNWSLNTVALGQVKTTVGDHANYYFQVRNTGNGPIDVTARETASAPSAGVANWSVAGTMVPTTNVYVLAASTDGSTWQPFGGAPVNLLSTGGASLATHATLDVDLLFQAPTAVTSFGTRAITVTLTATTPD